MHKHDPNAAVRLAFAALATLLAHSTAFHPSARPVPGTPAQIHALLRSAPSIPANASGPAPVAGLHGTARAAAANATCERKPSFSRVTAVAGDWDVRTEGYELIDTDNIFFRAGLGWGPDEIRKSKQAALAHMVETFGIPRDKFDVPARYEPGTPPNGRLVVYPVVFGPRYHSVADSGGASGGCGTSSAVWGGWEAIGTNISITGAATQGERITTDPRETVRLYWFYMLFDAGTPDVRVLEFTANRPLMCGPTGCGVVAGTRDLADGRVGEANGVAFLDGPVLKARVMLTWPEESA